VGGAGENIHYGGPCDDKMIAGLGVDWMKGGQGKDIYVIYLAGQASHIVDPDNENLLVLKGDGITSHHLGLSLNEDYSELAFTYQGIDLVTVDVRGLERRVRPDGSLDTGHFTRQLYRHFSYVQLVDTQEPGPGEEGGGENNETATEQRFTQHSLMMFYQDRLNTDARLDNIRMVTAAAPVVRGGWGNDDIRLYGHVINDQSSDPIRSDVVYKLYGEQGHDRITIGQGYAEVYPGEGHNRLLLDAEGKAFVQCTEEPSRSFTLSMDTEPGELRSKSWLPVAESLKDLPSHGNPGQGRNPFGLSQAVCLDKRDQWLQVPTLRVAQEMMVSVWVKISGVSRDILPVFRFAESGGQQSIEVAKTDLDSLFLSVTGDHPEESLRLVLPGFFSGEHWTHLAVSLSSDGKVMVYKNGESVTEPLAGPMSISRIWSSNVIGRLAQGVVSDPALQSDERLCLDGLIVTRDIPDRETLRKLVASSTGALILVSSDCGKTQAYLTDWPDYLVLQDTWFLDGRETVRAWLEAEPSGSFPIHDRQHVFIADASSRVDMFLQGDGWEDIHTAPGSADLLVVDVHRDDQVLFRAEGSDLIIYRFLDGDDLQSAPLSGVTDRRRYRDFFVQDSPDRVERIEVNHRVISVADIWSLTNASTGPVVLLRGSSLADIRVLKVSDQLLFFFKGGILGDRIRLESLWPWSYPLQNTRHQHEMSRGIWWELAGKEQSFNCSAMDWQGMAHAWGQQLLQQGVVWKDEAELLALSAQDLFSITSEVSVLPA
ncbi:MAG: hypothetical protein ACPG5T_03665, partial [Endozoicomonas sp.]